ncbi:hypothetical protein JL720_13766 [Aureococcus anophagefferens]|nr:hypothetical protein JL720_13766 [Aureococcus anophagefferens]
MALAKKYTPEQIAKFQEQLADEDLDDMDYGVPTGMVEEEEEEFVYNERAWIDEHGVYRTPEAWKDPWVIPTDPTDWGFGPIFRARTTALPQVLDRDPTEEEIEDMVELIYHRMYMRGVKFFLDGTTRHVKKSKRKTKKSTWGNELNGQLPLMGPDGPGSKKEDTTGPEFGYMDPKTGEAVAGTVAGKFEGNARAMARLVRAADDDVAVVAPLERLDGDLVVASYNLLAPLFVRPIDKRTGAVQPFAAFAWVPDDVLAWPARRDALAAQRVLVGVAKGDGAEVAVASAHLDAGSEEKRRHGARDYGRARSARRGRNLRLVIAGDLNAELDAGSALGAMVGDESADGAARAAARRSACAVALRREPPDGDLGAWAELLDKARTRTAAALRGGLCNASPGRRAGHDHEARTFRRRRAWRRGSWTTSSARPRSGRPRAGRASRPTRRRAPRGCRTRRGPATTTAAAAPLPAPGDPRDGPLGSRGAAL